MGNPQAQLSLGYCYLDGEGVPVDRVKAMEYFKMAHDRENYGRAYRYYRKEVIEKNILWAVIVIAALLIIPVVLRRIKKIKAEVEEYDRRKVRN